MLDPAPPTRSASSIPRRSRACASEAWPQPENVEEVHEALLWMGYVTVEEGRPWQRLARRARGRGPRRPRGRPLVRRRGVARSEGGPARAARGARPDRQRRPAARGARGRGRRAAHADRRPGGLVRPAAARAHPPLHGRAPAPGDRARHRPRSSCASSRAGSTSIPSTGSRARAAWRRSSTQLAGFEVPAAAWEASILPARVRGYKREWLDQLTGVGRDRLGPVLGRGRRGDPADADRLRAARGSRGLDGAGRPRSRRRGSAGRRARGPRRALAAAARCSSRSSRARRGCRRLSSRRGWGSSSRAGA